MQRALTVCLEVPSAALLENMEVSQRQCQLFTHVYSHCSENCAGAVTYPMAGATENGDRL